VWQWQSGGDNYCEKICLSNPSTDGTAHRCRCCIVFYNWVMVSKQCSVTDMEIYACQVRQLMGPPTTIEWTFVNGFPSFTNRSMTLIHPRPPLSLSRVNDGGGWSDIKTLIMGPLLVNALLLDDTIIMGFNLWPTFTPSPLGLLLRGDLKPKLALIVNRYRIWFGAFNTEPLPLGLNFL